MRQKIISSLSPAFTNGEYVETVLVQKVISN